MSYILFAIFIIFFILCVKELIEEIVYKIKKLLHQEGVEEWRKAEQKEAERIQRQRENRNGAGDGAHQA